MDNLTSNPTPTVHVSLELDDSLMRICTSGDQKNQPVCEILAQGVTELMHTLGIPGQAVVELTPAQSGQLRNQRWMRLVVNGKLLRYPDELLPSVYSYLNGAFPNPKNTSATLLAWLQNESGNASEVQSSIIAEFFLLACQEIIKRQPEALLGMEQLEAYLASLPNAAETPSNLLTQDRNSLLEAFQAILNLKISIADIQTVANALLQAKTHLDLLEDLVDKLSGSSVEVHLHPVYLRELTLDEPQNKTSLFTAMRDGLFQELGMQYPDFCFKLDEELRPYGFLFKINSLTTLPMLGLKPDECLSNDTPERLQLMNVSARPAINPASNQPASLINLDQKSFVESGGLTTWDPWGFLILAFAEVLRKNGACFINRKSAQANLDSIKYSFPALIDAVQSCVSNDQFTQTLRGLVAEGIPIHDLLVILERMVDYIYSREESCKYLILDDRPSIWNFNVPPPDEKSNLIAFVRAGLKRQISLKYARNTDTLVAYLLDINIEELLVGSLTEANGRKGAQFGEQQNEMILAAIENELSTLPLTAQVPVILTSAQVRSELHQVIAEELPRISVVAFQELLPQYNIQPIARIALLEPA